jgi:hypothetical protein
MNTKHPSEQVPDRPLPRTQGLWRLVCGLILGLLVPVSARAFDVPTFIIETDRYVQFQTHDYSIGQFDQPLSEAEMLDIIRNQKYVRKDTYQLVNKKYFYFAYSVENRTGKTQTVFFKWPGKLPFSQAHILRDDERMEKMQRFPAHIDIVFADIPPGKSIVIGTRLGTGHMQGNARSTSILDLLSLVEGLQTEIFVFAFVIGVVSIMILYNTAMFLAFRKIYFLYYCLYSGASLYSFLGLWGWIVMDIRNQGVATALSGLGLLLFCDSSLGVVRYHPRVAWISHVFKVGCVLLAVLSWILADWSLIILTIPVIMLFSWFLSLLRYRNGFKPALHFVIGWGFFFMALLLGVVNTLFVNIELNISYVLVAGFAGEVCFFSFAIGQKARLSEQKALRENEHAFNQLKKVFYPHQIKQIKQGIELEKTMPTGKSSAYVISFDIVGSSKINHPNLKLFLESSIKRCLAVVSESYDDLAMVAEAYRIKEMGDGFLCSVGFPFPVPKGQQEAETALDLSYRFIEIFQNCVEQLVDHHPVYCSIGIAYDVLEGNYPQIGTREYDIYGRGIVLATRYEAFRKVMFPEGLGSHIICIHQKVYAALPEEQQRRFQEIGLDAAHLYIRDDLAATRLYYRLIPGHEALGGLRKAS